MQIVKYCDSTYSAHLVRGLLINEGINAQVINENIGLVIPHTFTIPSLQVQVVVAEEDAIRAFEILQFDAKNSNNESCQYCNSTDISIRFPSNKHRSQVSIYLFFILALISGSPIGNIRKINYCINCKHEYSN